MKQYGWDLKQAPHYWMLHEGVMTTLCGTRSRPHRDDFELRDGALPQKFAGICEVCLRQAIEQGLPSIAIKAKKEVA